MSVSDSENEVIENKSSGLFSLPAAFIKKLYVGTERLEDRSHKSKVIDSYPSDIDEDFRDEQGEVDDEVKEISNSLLRLINSTQDLFQKNEAFGSVKGMASEIKDVSESNNVLIALAGVIKAVNGKYLVEKKEHVFELPLLILKKFKFSEEYKKESNSLEEKCKKINSISSLNSCLQEIYDLFFCVYKDTYADKEELENFLFNIGAQVSRIGDSMQTVVEEQVLDIRAQGDLNVKMNDAVSLLSKNILSGNDLESLKNTVKVQLDSLQSIVEEERQIVKAQESRVNNNVKALADQVNKLKLEAEELKDKVKKEREQALIDPLTGLYNRQAYNEKISEMLSSAMNNDDKLSLLIWDIDHFKRFNDRYGHVVGDKVLNAVSSKLSTSLKENYFLARFGGEEFAMLLPDETSEDATNFAERVRDEVSKMVFMVKGKKVELTISCGISSYQHNDNSQSLFERADKALYLAKENGRNCVNIIKT